MKKHLLNFLLLVAPIALVTVQAQKNLDQGTIIMEITNVGSEDPQMAQGLEMIKGTTSTIIFKGEESITKTSMMGGMINTDVKMNKKSGKMDMFMDMMGQKIWIETSEAEAEKSQGQLKVEVTSDKSDTKTILGYKAYKVNINNPATPDMKVTGYVTEEIHASANGIQGMQGVEMPGFPLLITIDSPQMTLTMETKSITEDFDAAGLNVDTSVYKKMTMEEYQKSMGGMGMGF